MQYTKFYAVTYWGKIRWVWSRKSEWISPLMAYPKPLTYEGAMRKCKEAAKKDPQVTGWVVVPVAMWTW